MNDVILETNGQPVNGIEDFANFIASLPHQQQVPLLALDHRTGRTGYVQIEVP